MKLNRPELKNLIKECLIELLADGLSSTSLQINESRDDKNSSRATSQLKEQVLQGQMTSSHQTRQARVHPTNNMNFLPKNTNTVKEEKNHKDNFVNTAKSIASNPLIAEMLADTAMRATQENLVESTSTIPSHEQMIMSSGDGASKKMLMSDPSDVFGDSASKWSALAFAEKKVGV